MAEVWADEDVWQSLRPGEPFDPEVVARRFSQRMASWPRAGFGVWSVEERASGRFAGWIGPSHPEFVPELADEVELGWTLRPAFWGRGLASEGARAAVSVTFAHLPIQRLISIIHPENARSLAVARGLGMTHVRDVRHPEMDLELGVHALGRETHESALPRT